MPPKPQSARSIESRIAELETALEREMRISSALRQVGLALGTTLDLDELLELILQKITEAVDADRATLYLLDEAKNELVSRIAQGSEVRSIRLKVGKGIAGHVARSGRALKVRDAYADRRFTPEWDMLTGFRTRSILAVPMRNHFGKTIGVVQVLNKRHGDFSDADAEVLASLATQAAVSLDNSRLFLSVTQKNMQLLDTTEQLEHRVRDLKLLFDLESAMARASTMDELVVAVLSEGLSACEARLGAVLLHDSEKQTGTLFLLDAKSKKLKQSPLKDEGLIASVLRKGATLHLSAREDIRRTEAKRLPFETGAVAAVPLEGENGQYLGVIALYDKRDSDRFTTADADLVALIAANASTAIRLQLARESREREERLTTIGRLLSGVIHDLKTPLTVISGYVQLMQHVDSPTERHEFAELILRQFDHISAMQREVLEFARGEKSVLVRKVYLQKFFSDVKQQLEQDFAKRRVEFVMDVQERGTARFDEGKILRVIHNLARNAAEAMGEKGGRFTMKVKRDRENALVLSFSDTGPGIPKDIEHRLFQSFVTSGKKGGTGLGLAIVKKIAEEHSGSISVSSTAKGATFKLRLPQAKV